MKRQAVIYLSTVILFLVGCGMAHVTAYVFNLDFYQAAVYVALWQIGAAVTATVVHDQEKHP